MTVINSPSIVARGKKRVDEFRKAVDEEFAGQFDEQGTPLTEQAKIKKLLIDDIDKHPTFESDPW